MGLKARSALRASSAPVVEALERRVLLSTYVVANLNGSGPGSLQDDIQMSNTAGGTNTITFAPGLHGMITPIGGYPAISDNLTIVGPGPSVLMLNGENNPVNFTIDGGVSVSISHLTINYSQAINNLGALALSDCNISNNRGNAPGGGAIYSNGPLLTITDCTFDSNGVLGSEPNGTAGDGGAIYAASGKVIITGSTFTNNRAGFGALGASGGRGGAIFSAANLTLINDTITGNETGYGGPGYGNPFIPPAIPPGKGGDGGGIYSVGQLQVTNCTVTGNYTGLAGNFESNPGPGLGGGIVVGGGTTVMNNTIVAGNFSSIQNYSPQPDDVLGAFDTASGYNLIGDGTGAMGLTAANGNRIGTNQQPIATGLAQLHNYGGPTQTMALMPGSPAIGTGSASLAVGPDGNPLSTDQRGLPRMVNGLVDIGAYQVQPQPVVNTVADGVSLASGKLSLREALTLVSLDGGPEYGPATSVTFDPTVFHPSATNTITLTQGQLELSRALRPVSIQGPGAAALTITAANASRVLQVDPGATASISGLTISDGSADHGGAIVNAGTLSLGTCVIDLNSVATDGGGVYNTGKLTVSNSTFSSNSAGNAGGAIFDSSGSTLTVSGSTFSNNAAGGGSAALPAPLAGGAIANAGVFTIADGTFSGNTAAGTSQGGAIGNAGSLTGINVTIAGNIAGQAGGGIANTGSALLNNTIVAANTGGDAAGTLTGSYDLIGDGSGGLSVSNHNLLGTSAVPLDPKLAALANNGGPAQTMALLPGSPAIDAGGDSLAIDASGQALLTDQRGQPRITNGTVDIGAYEAPGSLVVNTNLDAATLAAGLVSLRQALTWADTAAGPQMVMFAANVRGTITLATALGPLPEIATVVTIAGPASGLLRVFVNNAAGEVSSIFVIGAAATATIDGLEISGGNAGITNAGNLMLSGDLIDGNGAVGGISNAGTVALTNCTLRNNTGPGITGGVATLSNCTLSGNAGPGIEGITVTLSNSTLTGNASGVAVTSSGTLSDCTVSNNTGDGIDSRGKLVVTDSTVSANGSRGIDNSGSATLSGCTISGNLGPADGGGILNNASGTLTLTNCTISGNQAHGANGGGGIENFGTLTLVNCTVSDNTSYQGSGGGMLLAGGVASLYNTIVALNHNLARPDIAGNLDYNYATKQTRYTQGVPSSNNLISDGSGNLPFGTDGNPANGNLLGTSITLLDPRLAPLGNYGGPTQTMALRTGSPAVDAGSNALAVGPDGKPLLTDQRGYYRIFNGTVDIGAYEFGSSALLPGDADADGKVDFADLVLVARNYGKTNATWFDGDFNNDGSVGFDDLLIVARNYGKSASLAAGVAAMFSASLVGTPSSVPTPARDHALDVRSVRL